MSVLRLPDLYLQNPFRVLGLPYNADDSQIRKRASELITLISAGIPVQYDTDLPVLGILSRTIEDVKMAEHRLSNVYDRIICELFWFNFCRDFFDNTPLNYLKEEYPEKTYKYWNTVPVLGNEMAFHIHKNLAILSHCYAIQTDEHLMGNPSVIRTWDNKSDFWEDALSNWHNVLSEDNFIKEYTMKRCQELKSLSYGKNDTASFIKCVEDIITGPSTVLISKAIENEDNASVGEHLKLLKSCCIDIGKVSAIANSHLVPMYENMKKECNEALKYLQFAYNENKRAAAKKMVCNEVYENLQRIAVILNRMKLIDPDNETTLVLAKDNISESIRTVAVVLANNTKDWSGSMAMLRESLEIAGSTNLKEQINSEIKCVQNIKSEQRKRQMNWYSSAVLKLGLIIGVIALIGYYDDNKSSWNSSSHTSSSQSSSLIAIKRQEIESERKAFEQDYAKWEAEEKSMLKIKDRCDEIEKNFSADAIPEDIAEEHKRLSKKFNSKMTKFIEKQGELESRRINLSAKIKEYNVLVEATNK